MAVAFEALDEVPGFSIPVHRALTEPILLGGSPRSVAILNGTLAGAVGLGLQLWLAGILIWAVGHIAAVWAATRVHILVKPTRNDISTNLVITTDRRVYTIELRAREALYMPSVAWAYPAPPPGQRRAVAASQTIPAPSARNHRYGLQIPGDSPPWRPVSVFDDGRRVYVVFPAGIAQGEMPPLFVLGADGEPQIVNSRIHRNVLIVDRLFGAAELRLGSGRRQQVVRIVRMEARQAAAEPAAGRGGES